MLDVRGREIRTSDTENSQGVHLRPGTNVYISCENPTMLSNENTIYCNFKNFPRAVKPNDIIYIDDGKIVCLVSACEEVSCFS